MQEMQEMILRTIRVLKYENTDVYIHDENLYEKVIVPCLNKQIPQQAIDCRCPVCGGKIYSEFKYCGNCGQAIL